MSGLLPFPPQTILEATQVLFLLFVGHALADFPLQGEFLSTCKNRQFLVNLKDPARPLHIWPWCMTAHCLIHAAAVWAITGCFTACITEFILHWIIDFTKCEQKASFTTDQALHCLCKIAYVILAMLL